MRPVMPLVAASALALGSALAVVPAPESARAADNACPDLATTGACFLLFEEFGSSPVEFTVPESVGAITVLVAGASGGNAGGEAAMGGVGSLLVTTLDMSAGRDFTVWLGDEGDASRAGWSTGGAGAPGPGAFHDGGGGGGSTAIALTPDGHDQPLMVAAGGGGGGGTVSIQGGASDGGGIGGQGGSWGADGEDGHKDNASNGTGGSKDGASGDDGQAAVSEGEGVNAAGGGGGGAGWGNGGGAGESGGIGSCNLLGNCPPDAAPGAGGGGAAGTSTWVGDIQAPLSFAAPRGPGFVHVYAGTPEPFVCQASNDPRFWDVPDGIERLGVVAVGGEGQRGSNNTNSQGTGGLVAGMIDVSGIDRLEYFVGCSGDNGGYGFGQPGAQGDGGNRWNMQGGAGGGATLLTNGDDEGEEVFFAAGGGGGAGGNANCADDDFCADSGGTGGSSAGTDGSYLPYNGEDGDGFIDGPSGGCAGCQPTPDGEAGKSAGNGGGGGGGGAGYPSGGGRGEATDLMAGGGGGAGSSYLASTVVDGVIGASGWQGDGMLLLIPLGTVLTSLTVTAQVTGDAAQYAVGPYEMSVSCELGGTVTNSETFQLAVNGSHEVSGIPQGASCTVTETSTGQATVPPEPVTVTVTGGTNDVVMTNRYDLAGLEVTFISMFNESGTGTAVELLDQQVYVECTLEGKHVALPPPAVNGVVLVFPGQETWEGATQTVDAPVGASCALQQVGGMGGPTVTYHPGSTVVVETGGTAVQVVDEYMLETVTVHKQQGGTGEAPPDVEYPISITCQWNGFVTLQTTQVSIPMGGSGEFPAIPRWAGCTILEDDRHGATTVQYDTSFFQVKPDMDPITVTNVYEGSGLHIAVSATGPGASYANTDFVVEVRCTLNDETILDETIQVPPTGSVITRDVDPGAACTIEETEQGGAGEVHQSATDVTMPDDGSAVGVEIENVFSVYPLTVTSTNQGDGAPYANKPGVVSIQDCTFNGLPTDFSATVTMPVHGGTQIVEHVLQNMECTATYADHPGGSTAWTVMNGDPTSSVDDGIRFTMSAIFNPPTTVEIWNTFDAGAVTVSKVVDGDAAYAANQTFRVEVQCTFNDLPVDRLGPDGIATLEFATDGTLIPGHGATQLETLVAGTECSAVEADSGGATTVTYAPAGDGRSGVVEAPGQITITNTFDATSLTVTKLLEGNNTDPYVSVAFGFDQACTFNGEYLAAPHRPSSFSLIGGQTEVFGNLPVGAVCHVREMHDWHATRVDPAPTRTVMLGVDDADLVFTNVFDNVPVTVSKELTGEGAQTYGFPQSFHPQLRCTYPDSSRVILPGSGFVTLDAGNGFSDTIEVPSGVDCAVAMANTAHATLVSFPEARTITVDSPPELTLTSRFDLADIAVSKTAHGQFSASTGFGFEASCVWPGDVPDPLPLNEADQSAFELRSGQSKPLQALAGSLCTVAETQSEGALRVVVTASGPGTSVDGASATALLWPVDGVAFAFENFMPGSLPVTGAELQVGAVVLAALILAGLGIAAFVFGRRRAAR